MFSIPMQGKIFLMEVEMPTGEVHRHTLLDEVYDGPNSAAHALVEQFFDTWLSPFLSAYMCVVVDNDDARRSHPSLI